jgi:putative tricarboxylic transport membrane protein
MKGERSMLADRIGGLITIIFGGVAISEAVRLYPTRESFYVGDHLMPGIVGAAMVLLGLIMVIRKGERFKVQFPDKVIMRKMLLVMGALILYWILINYMGYIFSTFIISCLLFRLIGSYPYVKAAIFSAGVTVVIYFVFIYWLDMLFPAGFFFS